MRTPSWFRFPTPLRRMTRGRSPKAGRGRRAALTLEWLEDRTLPAPVLTLASTVAVTVTNGDVVTTGGELIPLTGGGGTAVGSAPAGTVLTNSGTWCDTTAGATFTSFAASAGSFSHTTNGTNPTASGTWNWQGSGTGQITITATDSDGSSTSVQFWLNVNNVFQVTTTADTNLNSTANSGLPVTLRDAITAVNGDMPATPGTPDFIAFNISAASDAAGYPPGYNGAGFNNPQPGDATITPQQSALPTVQQPVIIDGFTQPGSLPNTLPLMSAGAGDNANRTITLDGSMIGSNGDGLAITGGDSTVQGLAVNNFGNGIHLTTNGNDVIAGNYLASVYIDNVPYNTIGGTTPAARNLIGAVTLIGNGTTINGLTMPGPGATNNQLLGNYIGTDGAQMLPSGGGVLIYEGASDNVVGGTGIATRTGNVIEGSGDGIQFDYGGFDDGNLVEGNYIGPNAAGTAVPLGVFGTGIFLTGWARNTIIDDNVVSGWLSPTGTPTGQVIVIGSGTVLEENEIGTNAAGTGALPPKGVDVGFPSSGVWDFASSDLMSNIIAFNDGPGVVETGGVDNGVVVAGGADIEDNSIYDNGGPGVLVMGTGADIEYNSIYGNGDLGIDLGSNYPIPDSVSTNAANDLANHVGPNNLMNSPVLTSASTSSASTTVSGTLDLNTVGGPFLNGTQITLDFYANTSPDPSGYGQGQTWLGSCDVYANGAASETFNATGLAAPPAGQDWLSATATDNAGNTSEFSADVPILAPGTTLAQFLQAVLPQSHSTANSLTIGVTDDNEAQMFVSAIDELTAQAQPVTLTLNLAPGNYSGETVAVPSGMTLIIDGNPSSQLPTTVDPGTPALVVAAGKVIVNNVTFIESGDAPTILVTGGSVTLRNDDVVQASTAAQPAIAVTGGTVDLGSATSPGNNSLSVNGFGDLVNNTTGNAISAVGDSFVVGGTLEAAPSLSFTAVTSSAVTTIPGQPVTLTATVRPNTPGSTTPTGSVDFYDTTTGTDLGKVTLSGGVATLTTSALALGTHVIQAGYGGDSNYLPSLASVTQVVITSILVLDPTAGGALSLSGSASISIPGNLVVDSNSKTALTESGNASVKAGSIQVVGGVSKSGNATFSPAATTGAAVAPDPLAGLAVPVARSLGLSAQGSVSLSGNSAKTISPGIYSQITVSGNASLTLKPGVYILAGGGLTVSGNASVTGSGVLLFNAGSAYNAATGSDGGTYGSITMSGNGTYTLSAPTTGTYAGILIFQDRNNSRALTLSGNSTLGTSGTIYAPLASLTLSGNAQSGTSQQPTMSFVVDTLSLSGNAIANTALAADGATVFTPAQIRTAYGINSLALDGTGQTIAIVEAYDDPMLYQALDMFDTQLGLTASGPSLYSQYGPASSFLTVLTQSGQPTSLPTTDPTGGWETEESLDVEWAHALAPGAQIIVVESNSQSLGDLMAGVATAASQPGVSVVSMSWGFAEGQAVFQADEALYDGVFTTPAGHQPVTFVASTGDYGTADPEYPAFSPNVLAVGGTSLYLDADSSYSSETGWGYYSSSVGSFIGSGGGTSLYEPEPAYQEGVQSTGSRSTPDVAFVADPGTGAWIADPYNLPASNPWEVAGGTSLSAPCWAGLVAITNQGRASAGEPGLSSSGGALAQQALYSLPPGDFNTIASGTNGGYSAAAGYNMVTGLGTPVANLLVPGLIAYQGNSPANLTAANQPASGAAASSNGGVSAGPSNVFNVFDVETARMSALALGQSRNGNSVLSPTLSRGIIAPDFTTAGMATSGLEAGPSGPHIRGTGATDYNAALGGSPLYYPAFTPPFTVNLLTSAADSATGAVNAVHSIAGSYGKEGLIADELGEVLVGGGGNDEGLKLTLDADMLAGIDALMAEWGRAELSSNAPTQGGI